MDKVQIVILAAGKSKRMLSDDPKALARLKGKPFLAHILDTLHGLNLPIKPVIVVGHKKERIFEELGEAHNYAHQTEQLGTGHAVLSAKPNMHQDHEVVLVLSTDQPHISKDTILNLVETHLQEKPVVTLATVQLPNFEEWRKGIINLGRIIRNEKGEVVKITEYKDANDTEKEITEINPAIYAFDRDFIWQNIEKIKNENAQSEYYLTDLIRLAQEQGQKICAVPVSNIIEGLQPNTPEELLELEKLTASH